MKTKYPQEVSQVLQEIIKDIITFDRTTDIIKNAPALSRRKSLSVSKRLIYQKLGSYLKQSPFRFQLADKRVDSKNLLLVLQPKMHSQNHHANRGNACGYYAAFSALCALRACQAETDAESRIWLERLSSATAMTSWIEKGVRCLKSNKSAGGFFTDENIDSLEILREYMRYLISHYQPLVAAGGRVNFTTIPSISRREMQEGIMTSREAWDLQRLFEDIVARKETTHAFLIGSVSHWLTIVVNKKSKAQTNNATKSRLAADKPNTRSNGAGVLSTCRADSDDVKHQQCQGQGRKQGPGESDSSVTGLDELKNELEILFFESYNIPLLSRSDKQVFEYLKQHLINDIPAYARRLRSRDAFKNKTDEEMKHIIYNGHEGGKVWSSAFVRPMSQRCNRWYRSCIDTRTSIELIHDCATGRKQFNEVYMSAIVDGICNLFAVADPASAVAKSIANATTTDDNVKSLPVPTLERQISYAGVETWLLSDRRSFHPSSIKRGIFVTMCELGRKYLTNKKATQLVKWTDRVKDDMAPILRECQNKCRKLSLDLDNTCNARSKSKANTCQTNNNSSCVVDATHATGNGNADEAITTDLCTSLEPLLKSSLKKLSLLTGLRELLEMFDNFVDGQYE